MLKITDSKLIEFYDGWCCWAQRRGHNLIAIKVWFAFALLLSAICQSWFSWDSWEGRIGWTVLNGLIFGSSLRSTVKDFQINHTYTDEVRKMQRLNSYAVARRDMMSPFRRFYLAFLIAITIGNVVSYFAGTKGNWLGDVMFTLVGFFLISTMYLDCCTFLGPGEHSKEKKEAFTAQEVRGHG